MPVVRYVALAALVFWLGGTIQALSVDGVRDMTTAAYVCGGLIVVALLIMKFVGPPPRAFRIRIAIAVLMLATTAAGMLAHRPTEASAITLTLGAVLLSWYARE